MRSFEYVFAPVGACLVFMIFLASFGASRIDFFPMPALLVAIFTGAYYCFRKRLDLATPFEVRSVGSAAKIGLSVLVACGLLSAAIVRLYAVPGSVGLGYSSEWCDGAVQTSSTDELVDMFMVSQDFLKQHGFQPSAEPENSMGPSGLISPHMTRFYYQGSYNGSPPFTFRLDLIRREKMLIAYAAPAASSEAAYKKLEAPSRDFVRYFNKSMNNELAAYRSRGGHL